MGGKVFSSSSSVSRQSVIPTVSYLDSVIFAPLGYDKPLIVGSSLVKKESGDIDIVVEKRSDNITTLVDHAILLWGSDRVKVRGQVLHLLMPIFDFPTLSVQVDVFLTNDFVGTAWLMTGQRSESSVPAVYRNLLLSFLTKRIKSKNCKYTLGFPKGLTCFAEEHPVETVTDPIAILEVLELPVNPSDVMCFEDLVDAAIETWPTDFPWDQFVNYVSSYSVKDPGGHAQAVHYVQDAILRRDGRRFTTEGVHLSNSG